MEVVAAVVGVRHRRCRLRLRRVIMLCLLLAQQLHAVLLHLQSGGQLAVGALEGRHLILQKRRGVGELG